MSEQQWYIAKHGHQIGPMSEAEVVSNIQNGSADGKTLVFTAGMSTWAPLADVPQLATRLAAGAGPTPPIPPGRTAHEIDFVIEGTEMQYVEVELDPGESAVAEAGGMMYMTSRDRDGDDLRRRQPGATVGVHGQTDGRRQAVADRREPVHDGVHEQRQWQTAGGVRRPLRRQDPSDGSVRAGRRTDLSEGRVSLRRQGRLDRHRVPEEDRRRAVRRRGLHHATAGGRRALVPACGRHGPPGRPASRRNATGRHRLSGGAAAQRQLRHPVRRRHQDGAVRRRGAVLRPPHWAGPRLAAVAAAQPAGRPHLQGRPTDRWPPKGRRIGPRPCVRSGATSSTASRL